MAMFCNHDKTEMIARREGIDYVRCQVCGLVFEADDLEMLIGEPQSEEQSPVR